MRVTNATCGRAWIIAAASWVLLAGTAMAVDFANINITLSGVNPLDPPTVAITAGQATVANGPLGTEGFFLDPGTALGEYPIRIGASASNDAASGVLLGYVRENGRTVPDTLGGSETYYASSSTVRDGDLTATNTRGGTGGLSLVVDRAGTDLGYSNYPSGAPAAANLAAAYFPFSQGWMAGTAFNANGDDEGDLDSFVGSPGLSLGANFIPDGVGPNKHRLVLPGVTDSRRQGFLFVNHAKNENNYAMSEPADDGNGWVVVTHDNATNGAPVEQDPLSFVYIPIGTPNVTMARIHPSSGQNTQPTAMQQSGLPFTIATDGPLDPLAQVGGRYRLSIPGHSPSSGVLLVSPSTQGRDAGGANVDNLVTYQADGNDWIIISQDLPDLTGDGEYSRERISYFNFAFLPFEAPPTAPAPIQPPAFNRSRIIGWNAETIEETPGGGSGEQYVNVLQKTADVSVAALSENLGDNGFAVDGEFLIQEDGVLFATLTQGIRDNSATGGVAGYGQISTGLFVPEWIVFTGNADPTAPGEQNINFAAVFFGADSGFNPVAGAATTGGMLSVSIPGENSLTDGVLMANVFENGDNYALVSPNSDGSGWDLESHDNSTSFEGDPISYVYLPYDSQNLIAGRVDENGSLLSSTNPAEFTLTREGNGTYRLSIPGKSPQTGMLMLNGTGVSGSVDNTVVYEPDGVTFKILGLDMITTAESNAGELVDLEDTEFSFAYIDFNSPPVAPGAGLEGDFDADNDVDGNDFLVWQRGLGTTHDADDLADWRANFGMSTARTTAAGTTAAVPEPATWTALILAGLAAAASRRRFA